MQLFTFWESCLIRDTQQAAANILLSYDPLWLLALRQGELYIVHAYNVYIYLFQFNLFSIMDICTRTVGMSPKWNLLADFQPKRAKSLKEIIDNRYAVSSWDGYVYFNASACPVKSLIGKCATFLFYFCNLYLLVSSTMPLLMVGIKDINTIKFGKGSGEK